MPEVAKTPDEIDEMIGEAITDKEVIDNPDDTKEKLLEMYVTLSYETVSEKIRVRFLDTEVTQQVIDQHIRGMKALWYDSKVEQGEIIPEVSEIG